MRILVAGPGHLHTVPMYAQTVESLRELGHAVESFDLGWKRPLDRLVRRPLKKLVGAGEEFLPGLATAPALNARLLDAAGRFRPDLFLAIFGFDLAEPTLRALRERGVKTACWWLNDPFHPERSYPQVPWYDAYFTNAPACVPAYRAAGLTTVRGLLHGIYPPWHRPVQLAGADRERYGCDLAFAGDWEGVREQLLLRLAGKCRVKIWGPWRRKLPPGSPLRECVLSDWFAPDEMAKISAGAKVVLNLHTWFGKDDRGLNPRVFEACGCGAFQVCDWKEELPGCFADREEIVLYRTLDEAERLVLDYLPRETDRQRIAAAAAARALRDHTYRHRMTELLAAIGL